jgi:hypothetical protein
MLSRGATTRPPHPVAALGASPPTRRATKVGRPDYCTKELALAMGFPESAGPVRGRPDSLTVSPAPRWAAGRRLIAVDGKSLRGAGDHDAASARRLDHATRTVLAQLATTAKGNGIPTVRTLLAALDKTAGLAAVVVAIDSMHIQDDTLQVIPDGDGD